MTKMKSFRLNTMDRAELKCLSKLYDCSETMVVQIALQSLANRYISDEELEITRHEIFTSEYRRDKSED